VVDERMDLSRGANSDVIATNVMRTGKKDSPDCQYLQSKRYTGERESSVVNWWSKKGKSQLSTLRHTSRDIQMEFVRQSGSGSGSIGRESKGMILPRCENCRN